MRRVARLSGDAWHDSVRRLFAETVDAVFQHAICLVSPLSGAPVRLVTAVDPERQELLMLREVRVELARLPEVSRRDGELVPMGIVPAGPAQLPVPADDFVPVRGLGVGKLSPVVKDWLALLDHGMPASADGCSRCQEGQCAAGLFAEVPIPDVPGATVCTSCPSGQHAEGVASPSHYRRGAV